MRKSDIYASRYFFDDASVVSIQISISGNHNMGNKFFKVALLIVQISVGLLGAAVFINSLLNHGSIGMTVLSLALMILGLLNGVKGIRKIRE